MGEVKIPHANNVASVKAIKAGEYCINLLIEGDALRIKKLP